MDDLEPNTFYNITYRQTGAAESDEVQRQTARYIGRSGQWLRFTTYVRRTEALFLMEHELLSAEAVRWDDQKAEWVPRTKVEERT